MQKRAGVSTLVRATLMAEEQELDTLSEHELQLFLTKKHLAHMVETTELLSSMNRGMCRLLKVSDLSDVNRTIEGWTDPANPTLPV